MRTVVACMLIGLAVAPSGAVAQPEDSKTTVLEKAEKQLERIGPLWQENRIAEALALLEDLHATPGIADLPQIWISIAYNMCCAHSRLGRIDQALVSLDEAVRAGFSDIDLLQRDTDLDPLRQDERFHRLADAVRARAAFWDNPVFKTPYREQLTAEEMSAGLARVWAEVKYAFVRHDRLALANWDSLYATFLPLVRETASTYEYCRLLSRMCAQLDDGHTRINAPNELLKELYYCPPIKTLLVENRVLITAVLDDSLAAAGVVPGVEIVQVDGVPVREYAERQVAPYLSASTPQALTWQMYSYYLLCGSRQRPVTLITQDSHNRVFSRALPRNRASWTRPPVAYRRLKGDIAYVALPGFGGDDASRQFDSLFAQIATARALILDVRENTGGNSSVGWNILGYLTDTAFTALRSAERVYRPGRRPFGDPPDSWETELITWPSQGEKLYAGPVALLIGPGTGSAAEDFAVAFDVMHRGTLIGEPTAGSTGQPLTYSLPGGLAGIVCVAYCTYPDGTEFVGVGIQPDIVVQPTLKSIRSGRDVVLDAAIRHLSRSAR